MDFSLGSDDWHADKKTELLNRKLFGGLQITRKKKSRKRRHSSQNKVKSEFKKKRTELPLEKTEGTSKKSIGDYPKSKVKRKKKKKKFNLEINLTTDLQKSKQENNLETNISKKCDVEHKILDIPVKESKENKIRKNKKNKDIKQKKPSKLKKYKMKMCLSEKYPKIKKNQKFLIKEMKNTDFIESDNSSQCKSSDLSTKTSLHTNSVKNLPNVEKLKHILASESSPQLLLTTDLNKMKKDITKSGTFILNKEKREIFSNALNEKAAEKLKAAKFRYINEKLYTMSSKEAVEFFKEDPTAFQFYHDSFNNQACKWPLNPVDIIIQDIQKRPKTLIIADFGCGNAKIAQMFPDRTIYSFDLFSLNNYVTACDMAHVPLNNGCVDIAIFCLALMGTNINDYLYEAHRILKMNGILKIAEVISRIDNIEKFIKDINQFGFSDVNRNVSHKMFIFCDFKKTGKLNKRKVPFIELKPCLYKKR